MVFEIIPSKIFLKQLDDLSNEAKELIEKKIEILELNPSHFKRITGYKLFLFRIRFENLRKEKRLVYLIDGPRVILLCILDRDKEYKDLENYLKQLGLV
ncbi:MAG: hypothetical protein WCV90_02885 [Candidatus Woesearchaeota archaeon]|jgi:mRNA-degrading endonuclease RelE of RelBE toxin-antitoxin system